MDYKPNEYDSGTAIFSKYHYFSLFNRGLVISLIFSLIATLLHYNLTEITPTIPCLQAQTGLAF